MTYFTADLNRGGIWQTLWSSETYSLFPEGMLEQEELTAQTQVGNNWQRLQFVWSDQMDSQADDAVTKKKKFC